MAIFGRYQSLSSDDRAELTELSIRGFDGQLDHNFYVRTAQECATPQHLFVRSSWLQRQLVESGAGYWAPIHLVGSGAQGPYNVGTHFRLSAASLIESRRRLDQIELYHIISGIVAALKELHRLAPGASANLKPSNVFIQANGDLQHPRVFCSDPIIDAEPADPADDLRALGGLIHQLVMHTPPKSGSIAPAFEWSTLGDLGQRWRKLCSRLLDERPGRVPLTLRSVEKQLRRLNPRRRPLQTAALAAAVIVLIGLTVALQRRDEPDGHLIQTAAPPVETSPVQLAVITAPPRPKPADTLPEPSSQRRPEPHLMELRSWVAQRWTEASSSLAKSLSDLQARVREPVYPPAQAEPRIAAPLQQPQNSIAQSLALMPQITAVVPSVPHPRPERAEYDAALRALSTAVTSPLTPEQLAGHVLAVEQTIQKLPPADQKEAGVVALLKAIEDFRSTPPEPTISMIGPASSAAGASRLIRWKVSVDPQTATVTYSAPPPRQVGTDELQIVFKRIEATASTPAFYLSTTEVSFGLFADVISASAKWTDVSPLLWKYVPRNGDPRTGPRTWEWSLTPRSGLGIRRTLIWLAGDDDHYPPELSSAQSRVVLGDSAGRFARELNPSKRQPMQYVSADAAIYFAELLGARLPTAAELQTVLAGAEEHGANLRDLTWQRQQKWAQRPQAPNPRSPDFGAFRAAGETDSDQVWTLRQLQVAEDDRPYDDGILWFREVTPDDPRQLTHLIGNVAEYAIDGDKLYVVGASSLSPPSRALSQACPVPGGRAAAKGWSDVGFRLALSIPPSPRERLRLAVQNAPTLLAAQ